MPENELEELEDNLWCHNHTHDDHVHHENEEVVDKFKFKKYCTNITWKII